MREFDEHSSFLPEPFQAGEPLDLTIVRQGAVPERADVDWDNPIVPSQSRGPSAAAVSNEVQFGTPLAEAGALPPATDTTHIAAAMVTERAVAPEDMQTVRDGITEAPEPARDAAELFSERGFVDQAPTLQQAVNDITPDATVQYWHSTGTTRAEDQRGQTPAGAELVTLPEGVALGQLDRFLGRAATDLTASGDSAVQRLGEKAAAMREGLHFISNRKLDDAAAGIAALWKAHLDSGSKAKLCVPQGVIRTQDLQDAGTMKSSELLFGRVMSHFSQEDRDAYDKRLQTDLGQVSRWGDTKVVLLDDWSLSGTQLANGYSNVMERLGEKRAVSSTEVHLVAASDQQLEAPSVLGRRLPTYAYYHGGADQAKELTLGPWITGSHSSTDFGFELEIEKMVSALNALRPDQPVAMPPLTNIARRRW